MIIDPDQIIKTAILRNKILNSPTRDFTFKDIVCAVKEKVYGHLFNSNSLITQDLNKINMKMYPQSYRLVQIV